MSYFATYSYYLEKSVIKPSSGCPLCTVDTTYYIFIKAGIEYTKSQYNIEPENNFNNF